MDSLIPKKEEKISIRDFYPRKRKDFSDEEANLFSVIVSHIERIAKNFEEEWQDFGEDPKRAYISGVTKKILFGDASNIEIKFTGFQITLHPRDTLAGQKLRESTNYQLDYGLSPADYIFVPSWKEIDFSDDFFRIITSGAANDLVKILNNVVWN